ncbi:hypothetical protein KTO58_01155 [Chitinophaga pendula]|uniref:hypothetical protein n=1 Tax=Chitinophaga TaxID=79328 RepID=UPI000BB036EA|nr:MULTISPECIES: hypothetical protein [Chitinophaga]ASZ14533.1 hypothetical protein CK934_28080 [Chitinophaga sp. MD30]UCJ07813.1 hypothetical protein KTO58_01155 [Chitinophaga pendula]
MTVQTPQLSAILTEIESANYTEVQNIPLLNDWLFKLMGWNAFAGQQMATAKKLLNEAKVKAYDTYVFSRAASGLQISPSMAKDYAAARCSEQEYNYDLSERCSRSCVHAIDGVRTVISALKTELSTITYGGI